MLTITLPPEIESRLIGEASRRGIAVEAYAQKLIADHLPLVEQGNLLGDLFAAWESEDGTADPVEISRRNLEVEEFKQAMNANRAEMEGPGSRRPYP